MQKLASCMFFLSENPLLSVRKKVYCFIIFVYIVDAPMIEPVVKKNWNMFLSSETQQKI